MRPAGAAGLRAYLEQHAAEVHATGLPIEVGVRSGAAADVILDVAAEHNAGLIVMTTHGHSGARHLLPGGVTQAVARRTLRPLLLLGPQALLEAAGERE